MGKKAEFKQHRWRHRCAYILCASVIVFGLVGTAHSEETAITHVYDGEQWVPFVDGMEVGMPLFKGVSDYDSDSNVDCATVEILCEYQDGSGNDMGRSMDLIISSEEPFTPWGNMDVVFYRVGESDTFSPHRMSDSDANPSLVPLDPCSTYFIYDFKGTYHDRTWKGAFSISDTRLLGSFLFDPYSILPENQTSRNLIQEVSYFWNPSNPQYGKGHVPFWVQYLDDWYDKDLITKLEYAAVLQFLVESNVIEVPDSRVGWLCNHVDEDFGMHYSKQELDAIRDTASKHQCYGVWVISLVGNLGCVSWPTAVLMENYGWQALDKYPEISPHDFLDIKNAAKYISLGNQTTGHHISKDPYTVEYIWIEMAYLQGLSPWGSQTAQDYYRDRGIEILDTKYLPHIGDACMGYGCSGGSVLFLTPASDYDTFYSEIGFHD